MARSRRPRLWHRAMAFAAEKKGQALPKYRDPAHGTIHNIQGEVSSDLRTVRNGVGLRKADGQALVETALALTSLLMALLAGIDVYLYAWDSWRVQEVAREAVAATVDAPSESVARAWLAERVGDQVRAKALRTTLDRVELALPEGGGYAPGRTVEVTIQGTHRFQFGMRPLLDEAPVRATAAGLVRRNRNW